MSNTDIVYQIINSSSCWSDYPIMTTLSIKQVERTLNKIKEAVEKSSDLELHEVSDEKHLCIYDNNGRWYGDYRVETRKITKYGKRSQEISDLIKDISNYKVGEE